jgi:hypothetical protein
VYQKDRETGRNCIRLRPVKIDPYRLTDAQNASVIKDLKEVLAVLEAKRSP